MNTKTSPLFIFAVLIEHIGSHLYAYHDVLYNHIDRIVHRIVEIIIDTFRKPNLLFVIKRMNSYFAYSIEDVSVRKKSSNKSNAFIFVLVVIWYLSAVVTITTSKQIMNNIKYSFFLCSTQFLFASISSVVYLKSSGLYEPLHSSIKSLVFQISVGYTFGFVLTNWAFSIVSAGFAETVKSAEPISTILIGLCFFKETATVRTYLTLVPICLGVGLSCYHNEEFNVFGFLLAAGSNVCFSSRAVFTKKLNVSHPNVIDEVNLFAQISMYGLMFLVPITLVLEGSSLLQLAFSTVHAYNTVSIASVVDTNVAANALHITILFVVNGLMFACYNLMSYIVLRHIDLVTHSVLNVFRRVFIIVFTSYYFAMYLSPFNLLGIGIAVAGVICFGYFRTVDKPKYIL